MGMWTECGTLSEEDIRARRMMRTRNHKSCQLLKLRWNYSLFQFSFCIYSVEGMYVFLKIVSFESSEVGGHRPLGCQQGHGHPPPGRRVPGPGASHLPGQVLPSSQVRISFLLSVKLLGSRNLTRKKMPSSAVGSDPVCLGKVPFILELI